MNPTDFPTKGENIRTEIRKGGVSLLGKSAII